MVPGTVYKPGGSRICINETCSTLATFGYRGGDPIYCKSCIPKNVEHIIVAVKSRLREIEDCNKQPAFGYASDRVSHVHHIFLH
jgi:hypothetical protein